MHWAIPGTTIFGGSDVGRCGKYARRFVCVQGVIVSGKCHQQSTQRERWSGLGLSSELSGLQAIEGLAGVGKVRIEREGGAIGGYRTCAIACLFVDCAE